MLEFQWFIFDAARQHKRCLKRCVVALYRCLVSRDVFSSDGCSLGVAKRSVSIIAGPAFGLQWEKAWQVAALRNGLLFFPLTGLQIFKYETTAYIILYYIYKYIHYIYICYTYIYIYVYMGVQYIYRYHDKYT